MHRANPTFEVRTPRAILPGAESLADLVALTLGPVGRAVLIDRTGAPPLIGGDGYTVATHFDVADPVAQSGVQALRNLAWEMSRDHGDGAATAVVLARAVLAGLVRMAAAGHDPQPVTRDDGAQPCRAGGVVAPGVEMRRRGHELHVAEAGRPERLERGLGAVLPDEAEGVRGELHRITGFHRDRRRRCARCRPAAA